VIAAIELYLRENRGKGSTRSILCCGRKALANVACIAFTSL
jgi:hypothetical protein